MKIEDGDALRLQQFRTGELSGAPEADSRVPSRPSTPDSETDQIQVANHAKFIEQAISAPSPRSTAVEALTQAIQSGSYRVDATALSRSVVQAMFDGE